MKEFKKFKEEDWYELIGNVDVSKHLVDDVANSLKCNLADYELSMIQDLWKCESPIEQLLFLNMCRLTYSNLNANPFVDIIAIDSQVEIKCGEEKYRVDFLIPVEYTNPKNNNTQRKFYVIECDGHDFHEKTKQQVIRDNKRTRKLQEYGYEVIRYSGSEIYHMSYRCAINLFNIIYKYFWNNFLNGGNL